MRITDLELVLMGEKEKKSGQLSHLVRERKCAAEQHSLTVSRLTHKSPDA